jgi:hypothetical protein
MITLLEGSCSRRSAGLSPLIEWKGSSRKRFSGGRSEIEKGTETITNKWIIKKRALLSSFFLRLFLSKYCGTGSGAFLRSIDDPFFSMLYITPKGDEKTLAQDFVA